MRKRPFRFNPKGIGRPRGKRARPLLLATASAGSPDAKRFRFRGKSGYPRAGFTRPRPH